jgi:hypothetical protein
VNIAGESPHKSSISLAARAEESGATTQKMIENSVYLVLEIRIAGKHFPFIRQISQIMRTKSPSGRYFEGNRVFPGLEKLQYVVCRNFQHGFSGA